MTGRPGGGDERGVFLVLYAVGITVILVVVALVVDLGRLRADRRVNKAVADTAARAGVARLPTSPWAGVCRARDYLVGNAREFPPLDVGSLKWWRPTVPPTPLSVDPCNPSTDVFKAACQPNSPGTWARLTATAAGGDVAFEIQSGYALPDARFPDDQAVSGDNGAAAKGSCDNLAVVVTQRRQPLFGGIVDPSAKTTRVRSVGRLNTVTNIKYIPALLLLEQNKCQVLVTGGSGTRVIAQPYQDKPGVIQIDSAKDSGCTQPLLDGQSTSSGPTIVACSARLVPSTPGCNPATGEADSRIGIYALNFGRPPTDLITSPYPGSYGDTRAIESPRSSREPIDKLYRQNLVALDAEAKSVLTGRTSPPGCTPVVLSLCTDLAGRVWLVLQPPDCSSLGAFFGVPGRTDASHIWFNCDLSVTAPLSLSGADATIVVTGQLHVGSTFAVADPRTIFIGGRATGNRIGLDVGGATSVFSVNRGAAADCAGRAGLGRTTRLVVGSGTLKMGSGSTANLCQTFVYMASGYDKLPASDGTAPCNTCGTYSGTLDVSSNSFVDWSAPNRITGRAADPGEIQSTSPYEDLSFWTEAGGNNNGLTGGGQTRMAGIYFLGNADSFNLAGNGSLPVLLSAQFIARRMSVTGNATVNLVPNPNDSVPVITYSVLLVR
jgi:hypothetical protein